MSSKARYLTSVVEILRKLLNIISINVITSFKAVKVCAYSTECICFVKKPPTAALIKSSPIVIIKGLTLPYKNYIKL